MWLPKPIYGRVPQYWLLLGALFMSSGAYLGFDNKLSYVYFGVGFACCVWGIWVYSKRTARRQEQPRFVPDEAAPADEPANTEPTP